MESWPTTLLIWIEKTDKSSSRRLSASVGLCSSIGWYRLSMQRGSSERTTAACGTLLNIILQVWTLEKKEKKLITDACSCVWCYCHHAIWLTWCKKQTEWQVRSISRRTINLDLLKKLNNWFAKSSCLYVAWLQKYIPKSNYQSNCMVVLSTPV